MTEESKSLKVGDRMPDGTIYAGISPDTNRPMYLSPFDQFAFFDTQSLRYSDIDKISLSEAFETAGRKDHHGHKDWRIPTLMELSVLFNNRAAFGRIFNATNANEGGKYWTSTDGMSVYFPNDARCKDPWWPHHKGMHFFDSHGLGTNAVRFVRS